MPHYKDGTEAKVGDFVFGKPYNTPHPIAGTLISITPGAESCNCQVQYILAVPPEAREPHLALLPAPRWVKGQNHGSSGDSYALYQCVDYGAISDFTPVRTPPKADYELVTQDGQPGIRCLHCEKVSFNPTDIAQRYCAFCKLFYEDAQGRGA